MLQLEVVVGVCIRSTIAIINWLRRTNCYFLLLLILVPELERTGTYISEIIRRTLLRIR